MIWGIRTGKGSSDYAEQLLPIKGASTFVSLLNSSTQMLTTPGHNKAHSYALMTNEKEDLGIVVTSIPKSDRRPIQSVWQGQNKYYIRAGSSSASAPHSVIAGMFGASPQPNVFVFFLTSAPEVTDDGIKMEISVTLHNRGEALAKEVNGYMEISGPGTPSTSGIGPTNMSLFKYAKSTLSGVKISFVANDDFKLGIEQEVIALTMRFVFKPPFNNGMRIEGLVHCAGQPPSRLHKLLSEDELQSAYDAFLKGDKEAYLKIFRFKSDEESVTDSNPE